MYRTVIFAFLSFDLLVCAHRSSPIWGFFFFFFFFFLSPRSLCLSLCMVTVVFVFTCYSAQNDSPLLLLVSVLFWCTQNSDNGFYHFIFYSTEQLNVVCVACCICEQWLWSVFHSAMYSSVQHKTHTKHSLHTPNTPYSESSITPHAVCLSLGLQQAKGSGQCCFIMLQTTTCDLVISYNCNTQQSSMCHVTGKTQYTQCPVLDLTRLQLVKH